MEIENVDYVVCPICLKKFKRISVSHLKRHNLTMVGFRKQFPNKSLVCEKTRKFMGDLQRGENNPVHKNGVWNKGKKKETDKRVAKYSNSLKGHSFGTLIERFGKERAEKILKKRVCSLKIVN